MSVQTSEFFNDVARELDLAEDELVKEGVRALLEHHLRGIRAEIFEITGRYGIGSVEEMEGRYRERTLEEADSWRDFQQLDRLEFRRDRLAQFLERLP